MNKMVVVGVILVILGLGGLGVSFISTTNTETYKETVPAEEEVTKVREVPVETQMPKTREVEKQRIETVTEKIPVWQENMKTTKFITESKGATAFISDFEINTDKPMKFVVKNPIKPEINSKLYMIDIG